MIANPPTSQICWLPMCMDDILYIVFYNLFEKDMLVKLYAGNYNTPNGLVNRAYGSFKASTIYADKHIYC